MAARLIVELRCQLETCRYRLADLVDNLRAQDLDLGLPTEGEIFRDILGLQAEFDEVELVPDSGEIRVTVGPIVLEDIDLGRFQICLDWLGTGSASPYRVVALDPHPASSNDAVTRRRCRRKSRRGF